MDYYPREVVVTTVECDDWIGLYVGDQLVYEGHSLPWHFLMRHIDGCAIYEWNRYRVSDEWMEEVGLPKRSTQIRDGILSDRIEGSELK
jgi:hypothetical protein